MAKTWSLAAYAPFTIFFMSLFVVFIGLCRRMLLLVVIVICCHCRSSSQSWYVGAKLIVALLIVVVAFFHRWLSPLFVVVRRSLSSVDLCRRPWAMTWPLPLCHCQPMTIPRNASCHCCVVVFILVEMTPPARKVSNNVGFPPLPCAAWHSSPPIVLVVVPPQVQASIMVETGLPLFCPHTYVCTNLVVRDTAQET